MQARYARNCVLSGADMESGEVGRSRIGKWWKVVMRLSPVVAVLVVETKVGHRCLLVSKHLGLYRQSCQTHIGPADQSITVSSPQLIRHRITALHHEGVKTARCLPLLALRVSTLPISLAVHITSVSTVLRLPLQKMVSDKQTVLLLGDLDHTSAEWKALGSKYHLKHFPKGGRAKFLEKCKSGEFRDVVGLYRSNASTAQTTGPFDEELIQALPEKLKYICHNGAGYDNIDVPAASRRGLRISSTPVAVDNATADVAIFLMLGALRKAMIPLNALRDGKFRGSTPIGHDPEGKTLGILGMGGIGRVRYLGVPRRIIVLIQSPGCSTSGESFWHADHLSQQNTAT